MQHHKIVSDNNTSWQVSNPGLCLDTYSQPIAYYFLWSCQFPFDSPGWFNLGVHFLIFGMNPFRCCSHSLRLSVTKTHSTADTYCITTRPLYCRVHHQVAHVCVAFEPQWSSSWKRAAKCGFQIIPPMATGSTGSCCSQCLEAHLHLEPGHHKFPPRSNIKSCK